MLQAAERERLLQVKLPSPSGALQKILECARDNEVDLAKVAHAISRDPALAARVLRLANSPLYAQRRKSANLRQAVVALGLTTALTLALSVTIWSSLSEGQRSDVYYPWIWRRAVVSGAAARKLGEAIGLRDGDDLFLAGLLQDLGVFALGQAVPGFYLGMGGKCDNHGDLQTHERARAGTDHAAVGAWLLQSWGLPERICSAIERSHNKDFREARTESDKFELCVRLGGLLADCVLRQEDRRIAREALALVERCLGISQQQFAGVIEGINALQAEMRALFDTNSSSTAISETTLQRARARLQGFGAGTHSDRGNPPVRTISRVLELDSPDQLDPITGLLNQEALVRVLDREFQYAIQHGWPLSVLVISAGVQSAISRPAGHTIDQASLVAAAQVLFAATRDSDVLARHGVERFALILAGADAQAARQVAQRLSAATVNGTAIDGRSARFAFSVGLATLDCNHAVASASDLLATAGAELR